MWHILGTLFSWPNGIVVGNLIASALWAGPALLHLDRLARKHHRERMAQTERHHMARLAMLERHHKERLERPHVVQTDRR